MIPETENPEEAVSNRVSLRDMLRLIHVDTLHRVHSVGFLAGRLIFHTHVDFDQLVLNMQLHLNLLIPKT